MTDLFTPITHCRSCRGTTLSTLLNLGSPVLSDFILSTAPDPPRVPLELIVCEDCQLVQLRHTTDPNRLYRNYWYRSGINEAMRAELADVAQKASEFVGEIRSTDIVLDIGANDGTLLACFADVKPCRIAYEPAYNLYDQLRPHTDVLVSDFFPNAMEEVSALRRQVTIITSIACLYDLDDPKRFVEGIDYLLAEDGVWVVQMQDLAGMVSVNGYDNICHEHLAYYSLKTFEALLAPFDLHITQVERRAINGGSLRIYIQRKTRPVAENVQTIRKQESWLDWEALARFAWRVDAHKAQLVSTLKYFTQQGATVDLYAASTKSSTLLQHCGLDHRMIRAAVERSEEKWGLVTSGTRIPIISEAEWRENPASLVLLGAWQFAKQFYKREAAYLAAGGRFLTPLPSTELVAMETQATA